MSYYKKKTRVKSHRRFDPRVGKKVEVSSYNRDQRYRKWESVTREEAIRRFNQYSQQKAMYQKELDKAFEKSIVLQTGINQAFELEQKSKDPKNKEHWSNRQKELQKDLIYNQELVKGYISRLKALENPLEKTKS